jgi:hypothetical protein
MFKLVSILTQSIMTSGDVLQYVMMLSFSNMIIKIIILVEVKMK